MGQIVCFRGQDICFLYYYMEEFFFNEIEAPANRQQFPRNAEEQTP